MDSSKISIAESIKTRILEEGLISFRDFMEMALYYPELGYYTSHKEKIGKNGDFYTSPCLTPLFGRLIGKQLEEMSAHIGGDKFTVIEYGAGTGILCRDIIAYLKCNPELYARLNYCIIEKSPGMRKIARKNLCEKVTFYDCIQDISSVHGCILSNELVDNLSVHRVVMEEELMEVFVDYSGDFTEVLKPARQSLKNYLSELRIELPKGFRTEINLDAIDWIKEIAGAVQKGYVMTIDYGYPSSELYDDCRNAGTIACYNKHKASYNPYEAIGEQDITSHVNFSALCLWGYKHGLDYSGYRDQGDFLLALGFKEQMKKQRQEAASDLFRYRKDARLSHLLIEDMGQKFKVLVQQKGVEKKNLTGLSAIH